METRSDAPAGGDAWRAQPDPKAIGITRTGMKRKALLITAAAVAVDNWACEVWPSPIKGSVIPFHMVAIRDMGLSVREVRTAQSLPTRHGA